MDVALSPVAVACWRAVSYEAQGHQCVAVVSGYVGVYNTIAPEIGGANSTVTVFALKK